MRKSTHDQPDYFNRSLAKGLKVLEALARADTPLSLSEITATLQTNNTTTTRLCYTLYHLGFIQRDAQKRYHLTPKVLTLGYSSLSRLKWLDIAKYYMEKLFKEVQQTVNLAILDDTEILYLDRIRKSKYLPFDIRIGTKLPVHCTAMGKALMAWADEDIRESILSNIEFKPLTVHTITEMDRFLVELEKAREKRYTVNDEELTIGNRSVASPILNKYGSAFAAVNIAVPTSAYTLAEMEKDLSPQIITTAHNITQALISHGEVESI